MQSLRKHYPIGIKIVAANAYGLPIGKEFPWARCKEGEGSPFPFEVFSYAGNYQIYQLKASEVVVLMEEQACPYKAECDRKGEHVAPNCPEEAR